MAKTEKRQPRAGSTAKSKNAPKRGDSDRKSSRAPGKRGSEFSSERPKKSFSSSRSDKPTFSKDAKSKTTGKGSRDKFGSEKPSDRSRSNEVRSFKPRRSDSRDERTERSGAERRPARTTRSDEERSFKPRRSDSRNERTERPGSERRPARTTRSDEERSFKPRRNDSRDERTERSGSERRPARTNRSDEERSFKPRRSDSRDERTERSGTERRPARTNRSDEERSFKPRRTDSRDERTERSGAERRPARTARSDEERSFKPRTSDSRNERTERSGTERRPARTTRSDEERSFKPRRTDSRNDRSHESGFSRTEKPRGQYGYEDRQGERKRSSYREEEQIQPFEKAAGKTRRTALGLSAERAERIKKQLEEAPERLDENKPIRLNKYIANSGICGRREADKLIEAGVITVNGKLATELGIKVLPGDDVRYDGNRIYPERFRYVLLNKPKDYITTTEDPQGRQTVMFLVRKACKERILPVGRLDRSTTGLLLLTNDGELAKRLTHPSHGVQKIYHVELNEKVEPEHLRKIREGIVLEDGPIKADDIAYVGDGTDRRQVGLEIHSGRNRVIRRIFEYFGYTVKKLDRVIFAGLTKKDLPKGHWRFLTDKEISFLYMNSAKSK